jgi:uncharacterized membrane protein (DUF373 family)
LKPDEKKENGKKPSVAREWIARGFTAVEDVVYVVLGLLLASSALFLLVSGAFGFGKNLFAGTLAENIVELLDRILLILLIVELMSTVQISFREHILTPEPFILVGLIAVIRRTLVLIVKAEEMSETGEAVFRNVLLELGLLTFMIVALVVSLVILRKRSAEAVIDRQ